MSIGSRIRESRKRAQLTQGQLAAKVGMSQGALSELETGASEGTTLIASFAAALGVNALWLETGKGLTAPQAGEALTPPVAHREPRMVLAYDDEETLLDLYRRSDERGRKAILMLARTEGGMVSDDARNYG